MAHHSSTPWDETVPLGATGKFPLGKLTSDDEGEIAFAVGAHDGKVVMDFGKPTAWVGMTADQADQLADSLKSKAAAVRKQTVNPVQA